VHWEHPSKNKLLFLRIAVLRNRRGTHRLFDPAQRGCRRVEVNWNLGPGEDAANLSIAWREIGGPPLLLRRTADMASASFAISSHKSSLSSLRATTPEPR
jgi:hypothetical protein